MSGARPRGARPDGAQHRGAQPDGTADELATDPPGISDTARLAEDIKAVHGMLREAVTAEARRLPVPLTPQQLLALRTLVAESERGAEPSMSELTALMGLSHSTVSGIVTRLEKRGLVCRARSAEDGRVTRIRLSGPVRQWLHHDLHVRWRQPLAEALDGLDGARRTALVDGLAELRAALERIRTGPYGRTGEGDRP